MAGGWRAVNIHLRGKRKSGLNKLQALCKSLVTVYSRRRRCGHHHPGRLLMCAKVRQRRRKIDITTRSCFVRLTCCHHCVTLKSPREGERERERDGWRSSSRCFCLKFMSGAYKRCACGNHRCTPKSVKLHRKRFAK